MSTMTVANDAHSLIASALRGGLGMKVRFPARQQPEQLLEFYEFEACPYCRKVREALSELDLEYICHPTARGSVNRDRTPTVGGRKSYPHLVDPNTGVSMSESEDIIDYLHRTYGDERPSWRRLISPLNTASSGLASAWRPKGRRVRPGHEARVQPPEHLVLYNFEASPFCRKVRETLQELNLDHHVRNVASKSERRAELVAAGGKMMVPYLVDPNTDVAMYESEDIIAYLRATYGERPELVHDSE